MDVQNCRPKQEFNLIFRQSHPRIFPYPLLLPSFMHSETQYEERFVIYAYL